MHRPGLAHRPLPRLGTSGAAPEALTWPALSRLDELSRVQQAFGNGCGAVVAGPAGVGKTTLLEQFAAALGPADQSRLLRIVGSPSLSGIPLGALAFLTEGRGAELTDLLRDAWQAIDRVTGGRPLLLVDDAHNLDEASAALVHQLVAFGRAGVVVSMRSGIPSADALTALWKDGYCERIDLHLLDRAGVEEVASLALDGRVEGATVHQLWQATGGNLLYLRELLHSGLQSGALNRHDGLWAWDGSIGDAVRLKELVTQRLSLLAPTERLAMNLIATAEPVSAAVVADLSSAEAVETLERAGLVAVLDGDVVECVVGHPLFGEVVRATLSKLSTDRLRRELAARLRAQRPMRRADMLRLATWELETAHVDDPSLLLEAARWCARSDGPLAVRLAARALDADAGAEAALLLAELHADAGRLDLAERVLARTATAAGPVPLAAAQRLSLAHAELLLWDVGDVEGGTAVLADLEGAEAVQLRCRVEQLQQRVPTTPEPGTPDGTWDLVTATEAALLAGDAQRAEQTAFADAPHRPRADEHPTAYNQMRYATRLAQGWSGGPASALDDARSDYEQAITLTLGDLGYAALALGELLLLSGAVEDAIWHLREALISLSHRGVVYRQRASDCLAMALALAGELELARARLQTEDALLSAPIGNRFAAQRARAVVDAASGLTQAARRRLLAAAVDAQAAGAHLEVIRLAHDLCRLGDAGAARRLIDDARAAVTGTAALLLCEHIDAMAGHRPHPLVDVAGRLAAAGLHRYSAEAELAAADRFAREGQRAAAAAASRRASNLIAQCGPLHLGVDAPFSGPLGLTRREREIAELAAQGGKDADIADRLGLSVRTVHTHLHHVYCKLGVHSRDALRAALGAPGPDR